MTEAILVLQVVAVVALAAILLAQRKATATHTALLIRLAEKATEPTVIRLVQPAASHPSAPEKQSEPPPVASRPPAAPQPPPDIPPDSNIHEIVKRNDHNHPWEHHGWCRAYTPAWQRVWDTPHEALKIDGEIVEGVQDVEL
ncbi:MAG: hypothetical protein V1790_17480 [Planctomycetota bacterium]